MSVVDFNRRSQIEGDVWKERLDTALILLPELHFHVCQKTIFVNARFLSLREVPCSTLSTLVLTKVLLPQEYSFKRKSHC